MKFWKCSKCKRMFDKKNQQHSCTYYPVEKHLKNRDYSKKLYNYLKGIIKKRIGNFRIESLPCCIHFVTIKTNYTFMCAYALRDGLKIHFTLPVDIKNKRLPRYARMANHRYLYELGIKTKDEINSQLITWLKQAYNMKKVTK